MNLYYNTYYSLSVPFEKSFENHDIHNGEFGLEEHNGSYVDCVATYFLNRNYQVYKAECAGYYDFPKEMSGFCYTISQQLKKEMESHWNKRNKNWRPCMTKSEDLNSYPYKVSDYITVLEGMLLIERQNIRKIQRILDQLEILYAMDRDVILLIIDDNHVIMNSDQFSKTASRYDNRDYSNLNVLLNRLQYKISKLARAELRKRIAEVNPR